MFSMALNRFWQTLEKLTLQVRRFTVLVEWGTRGFLAVGCSFAGRAVGGSEQPWCAVGVAGRERVNSPAGGRGAPCPQLGEASSLEALSRAEER